MDQGGLQIEYLGWCPIRCYVVDRFRRSKNDDPDSKTKPVPKHALL